jgi:hypothetical protein
LWGRQAAMDSGRGPRSGEYVPEAIVPPDESMLSPGLSSLPVAYRACPSAPRLLRRPSRRRHLKAPCPAAPGGAACCPPRRAPSGRHQQNAPRAPLVRPPGVTVTLPIHPLRGRRLILVRTLRAQDGQQYVDVEHPEGWHLRLPVEWTDRAPPLVPPRVGGKQVHLTLAGLLKAAAAVEEALSRKPVPPAPHPPAAGPNFTHARHSKPRPTLGGHTTRRAKQGARRPGDAAAQGPARHGRGRGGKP